MKKTIRNGFLASILPMLVALFVAIGNINLLGQCQGYTYELEIPEELK